MKDIDISPANKGKFHDPAVTADESPRATVSLAGLRTLWVNTGTLCNITCANCYIDSSPENDALVYFRPADLARYLDEAAELGHPLEEVGFTGGEPFMNPQILEMLRLALGAGHRVLVLTNAMRPMMRPGMRAELEALHRDFPGRLTLRVSLDHPDPAIHDGERGAGTWDITPEMITELLAKRLYVNVHTADHPSGAIRGQVTLAAGVRMVADINRGNRVPALNTDAGGTGTFALGESGLNYQITVSGRDRPHIRFSFP